MDLDRSPLTVSEQSRALITKALRMGTPIRLALQTIGVPNDVWRQWRNLGERELRRCIAEDCDPEPHLAPYVEFVQESNLARAEGVVDLLERLHEVSQDGSNRSAQAKAAIWLLGRMDRAFTEALPDEADESQAGTEVPEDGLARLSARLDEIQRRRQAVIDVVSTPLDVANA